MPAQRLQVIFCASHWPSELNAPSSDGDNIHGPSDYIRILQWEMHIAGEMDGFERLLQPLSLPKGMQVKQEPYLSGGQSEGLGTLYLRP